MTEDEAKTKWCPFARVEGDEGDGLPASNRNARPKGEQGAPAFTFPASLCIASACMAWRTRHMSEVQRGAMFREERRLHPEMTADQLWSRVNSYDHPDGYCGLAGSPQ